MTLTQEPLATCLGSAVLERLDSGVAGDADVVTWISGHLGALEEVVYPAARRQLLDQQAVQAQLAQTRAVEHALRRLHQRVSGDGAAMHLPLARVRAEVSERLHAHDAGERELEAQLREAVGADAWGDLVARYRQALDTGPTRPHPNAPHTGWRGRIARSILTRVDRLLDALDARGVHEPPACG
jgi:hypothetical protein